MDISAIHKNVKLLIDGIPYNVEEAEFMKPGKGRALYRLKLRNLLGEGNLDRTYHSGDKVDEAPISSCEMQYLYKEGDHYVFMNTETFEQSSLTEAQIGNKKHFLKEGTVVTALMLSEKLVDVTLPNFVELKVIQSGVSAKKETFSPQAKSVVLETGYSIGAPPFVKEGDTIKVDTRTGTYLERITKK